MAVRVIISGRVQGVGYRAWTVRKASELNLNGWVRNRSDGTVEAVFSGDEEIISRVIEACQNGPMMARVDDIQQFPTDEITEDGFTSKPTI